MGIHPANGGSSWLKHLQLASINQSISGDFLVNFLGLSKGVPLVAPIISGSLLVGYPGSTSPDNMAAEVQ